MNEEDVVENVHLDRILEVEVLTVAAMDHEQEKTNLETIKIDPTKTIYVQKIEIFNINLGDDLYLVTSEQIVYEEDAKDVKINIDPGRVSLS